MQLPLLCEKIGAIELGSYNRLAGSQADKMLLSLEILKLYTGRNIGILMAFRKSTVSL